jgi:putative heme-binding domain-containing protein
MLHYDGLDWRAYTYAWRDDQTDANLVPADGAEQEIGEGKNRRTWQFLGRSQCMSCHSNQSEYALAFLPEQLNRPGQDGRNQLVSLTEMGLIRRADNQDKPLPPFNDATAARERKIPDPTDESQPLEARARGYLHANCGHCHSDHGGGTVPLRLHYSVPDAQMQALGVRPTRGDFGLPNATIIQPGDPYASTLYFRMAKFGRDRMPHIGSEWPDEGGLRLIEQWITRMKVTSGETPVSLEAPTSDQLLADPKLAMQLARKLGRGELNTAEREALLAAAAKLPTSPIRDLFEGYFPADEKGERKLGSNPRPQAILALSGDPQRGEKLFWSQAVNCGKCHRVDDRGAPVGPDLSAIGKQRSPADLLESLLAPSRRIEPQYSAYHALTDDGRSWTGVLIKRDKDAVLLRDGEGKEVVLETRHVEELRPLRVSLMPDGQLAGLTAQEAADLLAYLASRKSEPSLGSR